MMHICEQGATPELSVKRAFREAKRNLVHIERYKKRGLNYDLYGEHNNLKVRSNKFNCSVSVTVQ